MFNNKKIVCVIPARLQSQRFPRKMLASLAGRPLLAWVWEAANKVDLFDEVIFAVDDDQIAEVIKSFGGKSVKTSVQCACGTDRLVELVNSGKISADVIVNWQGDEPFIVPEMVQNLLQSISNNEEPMWTLKKKITHPDDIFSKKIAKVVCDKNGYGIYFSRSPIPCFRDEQNPEKLVASGLYYKHVGLYAYTPQALQKIAAMGKSDLEDAEKLEQLRFLDYGLRYRLHETDHEVFGIDTPEDLHRAEQVVAKMRSNISV